MLKELYAEYGECMVQAELLQSQIQLLKQKIVKELNKQRDTQPQPIVPESEDLNAS